MTRLPRLPRRQPHPLLALTAPTYRACRSPLPRQPRPFRTACRAGRRQRDACRTLRGKRWLAKGQAASVFPPYTLTMKPLTEDRAHPMFEAFGGMRT